MGTQADPDLHLVDNHQLSEPTLQASHVIHGFNPTLVSLENESVTSVLR